MKDIYIINERGPHFWGTHAISSDTSYGKLEGPEHQILSPNEFQGVVDNLKNKRVLVYIHGLRNTKDTVCTNYNSLKDHFTPLTLSQSYYNKLKNIVKYYLGFSNDYDEPAPYDLVIGYSWPSFDHEAHYFNAKEHAKKLAPKLSEHLVKLSQKTSKLDVMAHSMGNFLLFEALSKHADPDIKIDHIYSVAAAVPDKSLNQSEEYAKTLDRCNQLFVFHSEHDSALGWPYYIAENQTYALGLLGPNKSPALTLHHKIKSVNTSEVIKGHSDYLYSDDFYNYLLKIHNEEIDFEESYFQMASEQNEIGFAL